MWCLSDFSLNEDSILFDEVVTVLFDSHAPMPKVTCRVLWVVVRLRVPLCYKRWARGLDRRRFKRLRAGAARDNWMGALKSLHHLVRLKRGHFWSSRVDTRRDRAYLWRVINDGLGKGGDAAGCRWHWAFLLREMLLLPSSHRKSLVYTRPQDCQQSVLKAADRLLFNRRKNDHVIPLLRDVLPWLPVPTAMSSKSAC